MIVFLLGFVVIIAWFFHFTPFLGILKSSTSIKVNVAILFVLSAFSLYILAKEGRSKTPIFLSIFSLSICFLNLFQYLFNINFGIDELIVNDFDAKASGERFPGRMAFTTAFSFILINGAVLLFHFKKNIRLAQYSLHLVSLIAFIALVGHLLNIPRFYSLSFLSSSMAVLTAIGLLVLSIGMSFIHPDTGITGLLSGNQIGNIIARKLTARISISIFILTILRLQAHRYDLIDVDFGIALFATSFIIVSFFIVLVTAREINKIDSIRQENENKINVINNELAKHQQELQAIFDSAPVSIVGTNKNGIITQFNKNAEKMLEYKAEEVINILSPEIFHVQEELKAREIELALETKNEVYGFNDLGKEITKDKIDTREWTYVSKNGRKFPVQLVVSGIWNKDNELQGYLGISMDISDLKNTKKDLEKTAIQLQNRNAKLLNFAHITSHNLRSPVSNLNSLMYLYNESKNEEDKTIIISKFETVITHLNSILNDLIEALKIQEDTNVNRENLYFENKLKKIKEVLAGSIIESGAIIQADFSKAPSIIYPKTYLESILLNLLSNAIKYRSPDRIPIIHIKTDTINGQTVLTIQDNGLGIDLKKHGHKLFGLNKTFHRNSNAKGLGLFITKTQVEALGGSISAESEVNNGTTFKIIFN